MHVHRLFICTIGWTEVPIVRLVVRHGLEVGDFAFAFKFGRIFFVESL